MSGLVRRLGAIRRARPSGAPRLAVIGNCQGAQVATAMRLLLPAADVEYLSIYRLERRFPTLAAFRAHLRGFDHVFAGAFGPRFRCGETFEDLRAAVTLRQIPTIVFSAYHPDIVYVGDLADPGGILRGPIGGYHSALALFGYVSGFGTAATIRLFRPEIYRSLGYLDIWPDSQATLLGLGRDAGLDLEPSLMRWARRPPFMHLINHPRPFVLDDIARLLLAKEGIDFPVVDLDSYAADDIVRLGAWPVYPGIADQFGLPASHVFLRPAERGRMPRTIALEPFVEASFAAFAAADRVSLRSDRVETWLDTAALAAELRDAARG